MTHWRVISKAVTINGSGILYTPQNCFVSMDNAANDISRVTLFAAKNAITIDILTEIHN